MGEAKKPEVKFLGGWIPKTRTSGSCDSTKAHGTHRVSALECFFCLTPLCLPPASLRVHRPSRNGNFLLCSVHTLRERQDCWQGRGGSASGQDPELCAQEGRSCRLSAVRPSSHRQSAHRPGLGRRGLVCRRPSTGSPRCGGGGVEAVDPCRGGHRKSDDRILQEAAAFPEARICRMCPPHVAPPGSCMETTAEQGGRLQEVQARAPQVLQLGTAAANAGLVLLGIRRWNVLLPGPHTRKSTRTSNVLL